ncbi:phosphatidate phosphatase LPIN1-like isoform X2 [Pollicipes pollicipes]|uniref:phosphatidate phosphatase LPIN1-like isoform X2 n=1 Tax=Pollicipes pollicipes TaxID=41117 RepID=UPI0018852F05|nr:phosphatidate phosphatase LPIN1-like isoform X2 [Pollicipes pollicipes]
MDYIGKFLSNFKEFYNEINTATLTGAIDVVVAQQEDGSYISSPFHVRFGKIGVLKSKEKIVDIEINGEPVDIHMKLGESGEAFFVEPVEEGEEMSSAELATSPLPQPARQRPAFQPLLVDGRQLDSSEPFGGLQDAAEVVEGAAAAGQAVAAEVRVSLASISDGAAQTQLTVASGSCDVTPTAGSQAPDAHAQMTVTDVARSLDAASAEEEHTVTTDLSCSVRPRPGDAPLTFKARKVEKLVKLDGSTMFVPIKNTEKVSAGTQTERELHSSSSSGGSADSRTPSAGDERDHVKKRKQKKRKTAKHRRSLSETKVEVREESIFEMEDVRQEVRASRASLDEWTTCRSAYPQDCHPFSDTDLSPVGSPHSSRAPTPIKSDTEFEIERERLVSDEGSQTDTTVWQWGELPSPSRPQLLPPAAAAPLQPAAADGADATTAATAAAASVAAGEERSVLSGMFSFMRKTKKARHNPVSEGIYLDDLNLESLDPEVAALYFPRSQSLMTAGDKDAAADHGLDDDEGNGSSIPHSPSPSSPHSSDGAVGGRPLDPDLERQLGDVAMSLCGGLEGCQDGDVPESLFLQCLVTYDDLCDDPRLLERPELVVRVAGRYYNWQTAAPLLCSGVMFRRALPANTVHRLAEQFMPKKKPTKKGAGRSYSWWSWRRSAATATRDEGEPPAQPASLDERDASEPPPPPAAPTAELLSSEQPAAGPAALDERQAEGPLVMEPLTPGPLAPEPAAPGPQRESEARAHQESVDLRLAAQTAECETQTGTPPDTPGRHWPAVAGAAGADSQRHSESDDTVEEELLIGDDRRFKKTLRLSSEQIVRLGLHEGQNEALFSVTTAYQGTSRCKCNIFLWRYDDKIVVSDIDGTITKSDVLGHILPIVGQNWAQSGVAALYSKIRDNGYKFLYLSARAIGQAPITREYLRSVRQGDVRLPEGPLLLSPSSLVSALHREVIEKRPEDFKIPCLRDIQALFPGQSPLYAGYGNRVNDAFAYRAVGIPSSRIFTINHRGELRHELTQTFQSSYTNLTNIVDHFFPPVVERDSQVANIDFNSFVFWRDPIPELSELPLL